MTALVERLVRLIAGLIHFVPALVLVGCAGSFDEARAAGVGAAPDSARCQTLDDRHGLAVLVGEGAGLLAGGSGLSTVATDDRGLRVGMAIGAAVAGAVAAGAGALASSTATAYARECR